MPIHDIYVLQVNVLHFHFLYSMVFYVTFLYLNTVANKWKFLCSCPKYSTPPLIMSASQAVGAYFSTNRIQSVDSDLAQEVYYNLFLCVDDVTEILGAME